MLSQLYLSQSSDLDSLIDQYESVLSELLDKHAPLITRRITCRPHAPWFDDELREAKRQVRRCERKWMKSKLEIHRLIFKEEAHRYHELIKKAKCDFHKSQLENCNSRDLFAKINTLCKLNGWQLAKMKRVFLTCPCHEIYRDEAVGLKSCKNT